MGKSCYNVGLSCMKWCRGLCVHRAQVKLARAMGLIAHEARLDKGHVRQQREVQLRRLLEGGASGTWGAGALGGAGQAQGQGQGRA
jgi:hypothetical protein